MRPSARGFPANSSSAREPRRPGYHAADAAAGGNVARLLVQDGAEERATSVRLRVSIIAWHPPKSEVHMPRGALALALLATFATLASFAGCSATVEPAAPTPGAPADGAASVPGESCKSAADCRGE